MRVETKLPKVGTTIFTVMSQLAMEHKAVNLGQGFPDFAVPELLVESLDRAMRAGHNQYAPMTGIPALRQPYTRSVFAAMAWRSAGMPVIGAYWLWPARMARSSDSISGSGTGKSGKPWPRLTALCSIASWDITVKMVVPTLGSLVSMGMGLPCAGVAES